MAPDAASCRGENNQASLLQQQARGRGNLRDFLSALIKREVANSTQQIEAFCALQSLVGDIPAPLHGWPISADFALHLVRLVRDHSYDLIIEFGSGTSTFLVLRAMELASPGTATHKACPTPRMLSFEHLDAYHRNTTNLVSNCCNRDRLDLCLSQLSPWSDFSGAYLFYSDIQLISEALGSAKEALGRTLRMLVVIDGPPGDTCRWARYPAIPIVLDAASTIDVAVDFLIDDMIRKDEQEMALAWEGQLRSFGASYRRIDYGFEKGCLLLSLETLLGVDTSCARALAIFDQRQEHEQTAAVIARADELLDKLTGSRQAVEQLLLHVNEARDVSFLLDQSSEAMTAVAAAEVLAENPEAGKDDLIPANHQKASSNESLVGEAAHFEELLQHFRAAEKLCEERADAIMQLAQELHDLRAQAANILQHHDQWQLWLRYKRQPPVSSCSDFRPEVEQYARDMRELEVLRAECARRFVLVQDSEQRQFEQSQQLKAIQGEVSDLRLQLEMSQREQDGLQGCLDAAKQEAAALRQQLAATQEESVSHQAVADVQALELQLQQARQEVVLLLVQLHQVQEKLEENCLLSLNPQAADPSPLSDSSGSSQPRPGLQSNNDAINAFRQRLLESR